MFRFSWARHVLLLIVLFGSVAALQINTVAANPASCEIYSVSLSDSVYQIGETVSVTASYMTEFDEFGYGYGHVSIGLVTEPSAYPVVSVVKTDLVSYEVYTETYALPLDPEDWSIINTTVYAKVNLVAYDSFGGDAKSECVPFTLIQATQNISKLEQPPLIESENTTLTYKFTNTNNALYLIANHDVTVTVQYPNGTILDPQLWQTDKNGLLTLNIDTLAVGPRLYNITLNSLANNYYSQASFSDLFYVYPVSTTDFRSPVNLETTIHTQESMNTTETTVFTATPILVNASLLDVFSSNPLAEQNIEFLITDTSSSIVYLDMITTNALGIASIEWTPDQIGQYSIVAFYQGNTTQYAAAQTAPHTVNVVSRPVNLQFNSPETDVSPLVSLLLNGTLTSESEPLGGWTLHVIARALGVNTPLLDETIMVSAQGEYAFLFTPPSPGGYEIIVSFIDPSNCYTNTTGSWMLNASKFMVDAQLGVYISSRYLTATITLTSLSQSLTNYSVLWYLDGVLIATTLTDSQGRASLHYLIVESGHYILVAMIPDTMNYKATNVSTDIELMTYIVQSTPSLDVFAFVFLTVSVVLYSIRFRRPVNIGRLPIR